MLLLSFPVKMWVLAGAVGLTLFVIFFHTKITKLESTMLEQELTIIKLSKKLKSALPIEPSENLVVVYNRVPKTASTTFVGIAYDLCSKNHFKVLHINVSSNSHVLSLTNQLQFVQNVTNWNAIKPAFYHGHMAFVDFEKFGSDRQPLYINLLRKPLDRLVSYYYFLRFGDDFRPYLVRKKHGDKMTFDECVELGHDDCNPVNMWLQIPFFCGQSAECFTPGNEWALQEAKENLLRHYFLVGVTEQLEDFIEVLEQSLPRFFKGALNHFKTSNKSHLRKTTQKKPPSPETISKIEKSSIWKMENEFYEFALQQFKFIKERTLYGKDEKPQIFFYEKVRPR